MSLGAPTLIASINNSQTSSVSSYTGTTSAAIKAGAGVIALIFWDTPNNVTVSSITVGSNSFSLATHGEQFGNGHVEIWYVPNAVATSSGTTVTVNLSGACGVSGTSVQGIYLYQEQNLILSGVFDQAAFNGTTGAAGTLSCTTSALSSGTEIAIGITYAQHGTAYSGAVGFTNLTSFAGAGGNGFVGIDYLLTSNANAVTYNSSWTPSTSTVNVIAVATFIGQVQFWEIQPPQPPTPIVRRSRAAAIMRGDDGIYDVNRPFFAIGFEVQPPQPPARTEIVAQRAAAIMPKEDGIAYPFQHFIPMGWEIQPPQPPHPLPERRAAAIMRGDDGTEATEIRFFPMGWEIQSWQPPKWTPPKVAAALMPYYFFPEGLQYGQFSITGRIASMARGVPAFVFKNFNYLPPTMRLNGMSRNADGSFTYWFIDTATGGAPIRIDTGKPVNPDPPGGA